ncbi:MAG: signal recognition particle receptor subunit alpha, partial [Chloroflexota bacterium]
MLNWFRRKGDAPEPTEDAFDGPQPPVSEEELAEEALAAPPEDELIVEEQEEEREEGLEESLTRTRQGFFGRVKALFNRSAQITDEFYDELEELLIQADVGVVTSQRLLEALKERVETDGPRGINEARQAFQDEMAAFLEDQDQGLDLGRPLSLVLVIGVNGVGKTTTIGKLAMYLRNEGHRVMLAAGDTFRAAAIEQLQAWGERAG